MRSIGAGMVAVPLISTSIARAAPVPAIPVSHPIPPTGNQGTFRLRLKARRRAPKTIPPNVASATVKARAFSRLNPSQGR